MGLKGLSCPVLHALFLGDAKYPWLTNLTVIAFSVWVSGVFFFRNAECSKILVNEIEVGWRISPRNVKLKTVKLKTVCRCDAGDRCWSLIVWGRRAWMNVASKWPQLTTCIMLREVSKTQYAFHEWARTPPILPCECVLNQMMTDAEISTSPQQWRYLLSNHFNHHQKSTTHWDILKNYNHKRSKHANCGS